MKEQLQAILDKIESFSGLKADWDTYGANAIDADCIEWATDFVKAQANFSKRVPTFACPTKDGGVLVEYGNERETMKVRFSKKLKLK